MLTEVAVESKQRITYADFLQRNTLADGSLAWLIQRVINDVSDNPAMRQLSPRFLYHLDLLKRSSLGPKPFAQLTEQDLIGYMRERAKSVGRATCKHDLRTLSYVFKHAKATFADCRGLSMAPFTESLPYLSRNGLIGQGNARTMRCSDEWRDALIAFFEQENARGRNDIKAMPDIIRFALISARRRGEICSSITWGDVDFERQIYWVRNMKHPTKKHGNDKSFVLWPELVEIIRRQPRVDAANDAEYVFPFNGNVVGQKFCYAKSALDAQMPGISDLHFHDLRGTAISMWILRGLTTEEVRVAVSGHDTNLMIERVYDRRDASDLVEKAKFRSLIERHAANEAPAPLKLAA